MYTFWSARRLETQMTQVIKDLENDMNIEIATGVAELNRSMGDVLEKLDSLTSFQVGKFPELLLLRS
jgi:thymidine phosphorylase